MKKYFKSIALTAVALMFFACTDENDESTGSKADSFVTTPAPDYGQTTSWFQTGKEINPQLADVFYLIPTSGADWVNEDGKVCHFFDINKPEHRELMNTRFNMGHNIFGDSVNFFSPYYREITLEVWAGGNDSVNKYYPTTYSDVKAAFDYYMENWNDGRDFVLAGFSQGAKGVKELVKNMTDEQFSRMKAAYVIGFPVLQEDLDATERFKGATGADDLGVTISFNSADDEDGIGPLFHNSTMIINPVNWSTGSDTVQVNDTVRNYISHEHMTIFVDGVDPNSVFSEATAPLFPLGNYHLLELPLYGKYLRENMKLRLYKK